MRGREKIGDSLVGWDDRIMIHDWPECGPVSLEIETLYQAFRLRYEAEQRHEERCPGRRGNWDDCVCGSDART